MNGRWEERGGEAKKFLGEWGGEQSLSYTFGHSCDVKGGEERGFRDEGNERGNGGVARQTGVVAGVVRQFRHSHRKVCWCCQTLYSKV